MPLTQPLDGPGGLTVKSPSAFQMKAHELGKMVSALLLLSCYLYDGYVIYMMVVLLFRNRIDNSTGKKPSIASRLQNYDN